MEIMKIVLGCFFAWALTYLISESIGSYHYNKGISDALHCLDAAKSGDELSRLRIEAMYRQTNYSDFMKWRVIARLASTCAVGWCVAGYVISLF